MEDREVVKYMGVPKQWFSDCHLASPIKSIGYLRHEPTHCTIAVYKPISRFKAPMLKWCFGLKYEKSSNDKA